MLTPTSLTRSASLVNARRPINALLRSRAVAAACTPHHVDHYLALVDAAWSVRDVRARVRGVEHEADGATSLWLQPNENWKGFRAGQFVRVAARVEGVSYTRCFSISSAPEDGSRLRVTMKALPGGRLGPWASEAARRGDVVGLSQALGDFVLPAPVPPRLLFISGGSGITPVVSMVRHLLATGYRGEVVSLHYSRHEPTFGRELKALADEHPGFRFVPVLTTFRRSGGRLAGHFSLAHLQALAPRWQEHELFVCGPDSLQAAVEQVAREGGVAHRLHVERFVSAPREVPRAAAERCKLTFVKSGRAVDGTSSVSLLEQAEHAGLEPAHGCRMGICHSCKHKKVSGVVQNLLTGALSTEENEEVQLCVSVPRSDVVLDL